MSLSETSDMPPPGVAIAEDQGVVSWRPTFTSIRVSRKGEARIVELIEDGEALARVDLDRAAASHLAGLLL